MAPQNRLRDIAALFFKLGLIAFGGPAAHIAMMEDEVVSKRKWIDRQHFLDLVGLTNLIPGPNSTEMAMHCGHERAGAAGLFVAGFGFIVPAAFLTLIFGALYVKYGGLPQVEPFLFGIKPAVIAIILGAVFKLGRSALKNKAIGLIGLATLIANLAGLDPIFAILAGGLFGLLWAAKDKFRGGSVRSLYPILLLQSSASVAVHAGMGKLFLVFLKIGAVLFGSGYVLIAYMESELVEKLGWLTHEQLLDAVAIGQLTPGPVLTTATFVGYQINGVWGAVVATTGIFLPSFIFVWLLNPMVRKLRNNSWTAGFLDGVNIASVAVMLAVCWTLLQPLRHDLRQLLIAAVSIAVVFSLKKLSSLWLIIGSGALGYLLFNF